LGHAMLSFFQILARAESAFVPPPPAARKSQRASRKGKIFSTGRAAARPVPSSPAAPPPLPAALICRPARSVWEGASTCFLLFSSPAGGGDCERHVTVNKSSRDEDDGERLATRARSAKMTVEVPNVFQRARPGQYSSRGQLDDFALMTPAPTVLPLRCPTSSRVPVLDGIQ
jgi:hypothetical protein